MADSRKRDTARVKTSNGTPKDNVQDNRALKLAYYSTEKKRYTILPQTGRAVGEGLPVGANPAPASANPGYESIAAQAHSEIEKSRQEAEQTRRTLERERMEAQIKMGEEAAERQAQAYEATINLYAKQYEDDEPTESRDTFFSETKPSAKETPHTDKFEQGRIHTKIEDRRGIDSDTADKIRKQAYIQQNMPNKGKGSGENKTAQRAAMLKAQLEDEILISQKSSFSSYAEEEIPIEERTSDTGASVHSVAVNYNAPDYDHIYNRNAAENAVGNVAVYKGLTAEQKDYFIQQMREKYVGARLDKGTISRIDDDGTIVVKYSALQRQIHSADEYTLKLNTINGLTVGKTVNTDELERKLHSELYINHGLRENTTALEQIGRITGAIGTAKKIAESDNIAEGTFDVAVSKATGAAISELKKQAGATELEKLIDERSKKRSENAIRHVKQHDNNAHSKQMYETAKMRKIQYGKERAEKSFREQYIAAQRRNTQKQIYIQANKYNAKFVGSAAAHESSKALLTGKAAGAAAGGSLLIIVIVIFAVLMLILMISALFAWTQPHTETLFNEKTATFEDVEVEVDADVLKGYISHIKDWFDKEQLKVLGEIDWRYGGFEPDEYDYPYADRFLRDVHYNSTVYDVSLGLSNQPVFYDNRNQPINSYNATLFLSGTTPNPFIEVFEEIYYRPATDIEGRDISFSDDLIPCLITDPRRTETRQFMKNAFDFRTCLPSDIEVTPDHVTAGQEITDLTFTVKDSHSTQTLKAADFFTAYAPQFSNVGDTYLQYVKVQKQSGSTNATIKRTGNSFYLNYQFTDPYGGSHYLDSSTYTPVLEVTGLTSRVTNPLFYDSADYDNHIFKLIQLDNKWIKCNVDFEHILALAAVVKWQKIEHPDTDFTSFDFNITDDDIQTVLGTLYQLEYHYLQGNCPDHNCHEYMTAYGPAYNCNRSHKIMVGRGVINFAGTYSDPFELLKNAVLSKSRPADLETDKDLADVYYEYIYELLGTSTYLDDYEHDSAARARLARMYAAQTGTDILPENAPAIYSVTYSEGLMKSGSSTAGGIVYNGTENITWTSYESYINHKYVTVNFTHSETNEKVVVRGYHVYTYNSQTGARKLVATIDDPNTKQAVIDYGNGNNGATFEFIVTAFNNSGNSPVSGRYSFTLPTAARGVTYYYNGDTLVYTKTT